MYSQKVWVSAPQWSQKVGAKSFVILFFICKFKKKSSLWPKCRGTSRSPRLMLLLWRVLWEQVEGPTTYGYFCLQRTVSIKRCSHKFLNNNFFFMSYMYKSVKLFSLWKKKKKTNRYFWPVLLHVWLKMSITKNHRNTSLTNIVDIIHT